MDNQEINLNSGENNISLSKEKSTFIPGGRAVGAGAATEWISDAWNMFKANPGQWILFALVYIVILVILNFIPVINLISGIFSSVFVAGFIAAAEKQRTTGNFEIDFLFHGFKNKLGSLIAVSVLYLAIYMLGLFAALLAIGVGALELFSTSQYSDPGLLMSHSPSLILAILVFFIFGMVALAFAWFAPALIIINNLKFGEAVSMSLNAVRKNLLGGFLFFLLMGVLLIVSMIPFFLGLIVTMPMTLIVYYTTYRSIFYTPEEKETKSSLIV
ncbi:membrane protein [Xenorhabdus khoisanae]|uniref:Membrane protein n=1 Tax=Xenorhabdus khoisanae TaxID=880157 RepID=A0A0J5FX60_9GAMM|nr:BPSS1780 family membrane protein [Xenorhabdus khoisanae]KMJ46512.1 membrane protein [Xenorhabdus khoisanae]